MHLRPRLRHLAVLGLAGLALAAVGATAAQSKPLASQHSLASTILDGTTDTVTNIDPAGNYDFGSFTVDILIYQHLLDFPLGAKDATRPALVEPFAASYAVFGSMNSLWARWALEGRTHGVAEGDDRKDRTIALGPWTATVSFQEWQFGEKSWPNYTTELPPGTEKPSGGVGALSRQGFW